ncbi:helix-turn-helix domain-containing protein [Georgenia subflava]|uniref:Helix-turn-helix domain-containing protein n=1 Tax=Georgenia subflava TaxID=1622177 RepID=A0A6N7EKB4_9MICO|nr:helix-turn-helix domain-containing protein [Georgenia subflava]
MGHLVEKSPAPAVTRAAALLDLLAQAHGGLGLTEIARALGLAKSSTSNICVALEQAGLIARRETGYVLGRQVARLGGAYLRGFDLVREFYRVCEASQVLSRELLQLALLDGTQVLYLARHEGRAPLRLSATVGDRFPAPITAVGTALLSRLDPAEVRERFADPVTLPVWTDSSVRTVEDLLAKLAATAERGFAVDDGETHPGVYGVAVLLPAATAGGEPVALGCSMMKASMTAEHRDTVVDALRSAREELADPMRAAD